MNESNRNKVYIYPSVHGTTNVVNYSGSNTVNSFFWHFDIWGSNGKFQMCSDENHSKVLFECSKEFLEMTKTDDFRRAFRHMGVEVTYDANDILDID